MTHSTRALRAKTGAAERQSFAEREGADASTGRVEEPILLRSAGAVSKPSQPLTTNATVVDVAKEAGVSTMTVSRVINGGVGVRPETRRRVERAVAELDFVPNGVARGLMTRKTGTLGLIVPDIVNPFFTMVVRGAEKVARGNGYRLLLCNSEAALIEERRYVEHMIAHRVEGLLIAPSGDRSKANLALLARRGVPFVLIDRSVAGLDSDVVHSDSVTAARQLVSHLTSLGHRQIAVIIEPDNVSTARDRLQGYKEALQAAELPFAPEAIFRSTPDRAGGYASMQKILALVPRATAVFAVNNMTALGAMQAIRERNLSVPNDMALVCFDDVEHLAVLSPFLTVMNQPTEMFGSVAAQLLLERIGGDGNAAPQSIVLATELIVRESCGAKAGWLATLAKPKPKPNQPSKRR